jgi:hypothetical protein
MGGKRKKKNKRKKNKRKTKKRIAGLTWSKSPSTKLDAMTLLIASEANFF